MNLSFEQIKSVTHGALFFEDRPGGVIPRRFTPRQMEAYRPTERCYIRATASSGIRLELETDADSLSFSFCCAPGSSRDEYSFDLHVDGRLHAHFIGSISARPVDAFSAQLPEGKKRLTLFLPCLAQTEIRSLVLGGASFFLPVTHARTILTIGDSITQGYIAMYPSLTYPAQLSLSSDVDLVNQGIGGDVFRVETLDDTPGWTPSLITTAYGTNDWFHRSRSEFSAGAEAFLTRLRAIWPEIPIAVLTPIWRLDRDMIKPDGFRFEETEQILTDIASHLENTYVISGAALFPPISDLMADEQLHPNDLGFIFYASRLKAELKRRNLI